MAGGALLKAIGKGVVPASVGGAFLTPEDAEATFGGILAKGAQKIIGDAAKMEARGMTRDDIWRASFDQHGRGAFKGDDGLWRVEFNDYAHQMQYPDGYASLQDILKETEIGQAYDLSDTFVKADDAMPYGGSYESAQRSTPELRGLNKMIIPRLERLESSPEEFIAQGFSPDMVRSFQRSTSTQNKEAYRTLIHETQHAVQDIEGFAPGSNPQAVGGQANYMKTAGEVEARNVEARMGMTEGMKYDLPPWETVDLATNSRLFLEGEPQKQARKRQAAFLATLGLSTGAVAGDEMPALDDPEMEAFISRARAADFSDAEISAVLQEEFNLTEEQANEPLAARNEPFTPDEIEELYRLGATSQEVGILEADGRLIDYDNMSADKFAKPDPVFRPVEDAIPEVDENGIPTGEDIEIGLSLTDDEVRKKAQELRVDPRSTAGMNAVYAQARRERFANDTKGTLALLQEAQHVDRPWAWFKSKFGSDAENEYQRMREHTTNVIIDQLKERGVTARYEAQEQQFYAQDPQGQWVELTPSFMEEMGAMKAEAIGSVGGAFGGVGLVRSLGPYGRGWQVLGGAAGSLAGMIAGDQIDYLLAASETQQDWDAKLAAEKALGTAQIGVVYEVALAGVGKLGAIGWKGIRHAYRSIKDGNTQGAYEALKQSLGHISDDEIDVIIKRWETLNERTAPTLNRTIPRGSARQEQALAVAPTSKAGGEHVVGTSAGIDPQASAAVASEVNKRAQDVLRISSSNAPEDTGRRVIKALDDYTAEVKTNFAVVKDRGSELVPPNFTFDFRATAIKPLIEDKISTIKDPSKVDSLMRTLSKIEIATKTRSFDDMVDLRRTLNDFKFNKNVVNKQDYDTINEALANVDDQIEDAMLQSSEGRQWLLDWKDANKEYSKYAQLRRNALWKSLRKEGTSEKDIARYLTKYGQSIDSTFDDVMDKVPVRIRANVESSIADTLINKHTAGKEGEFRAIYFPELSEAMKGYNFKTPEAMRLKEATRRMATVYQNDPKLAAVSGKINLPGFQSYLTDDPMMRLKMASISHAFNYVRRLIPGNKADALSMASKVARLLEEPLNTKTVEGVMNTIKEEQELTAAIKRLQSATAREQAEGGNQYRTRIFRDKQGKSYATEGPGRTQVSEQLPIHRLVPEDGAKQLLGVGKLDSKTLNRVNKLKLVEAGFLKVRMKDGQLIDLGADYEF